MDPKSQPFWDPIGAQCGTSALLDTGLVPAIFPRKQTVYELLRPITVRHSQNNRNLFKKKRISYTFFFKFTFFFKTPKKIFCSKKLRFLCFQRIDRRKLIRKSTFKNFLPLSKVGFMSNLVSQNESIYRSQPPAAKQPGVTREGQFFSKNFFL